MHEKICQESITKYYNMAFKKGFQSAQHLDILLGYMSLVFFLSIVAYKIADLKDIKKLKMVLKETYKIIAAAIFLLAVSKGVQTLVWWF
ncbi:MAG: hypothetical protein ACOCTT_00995 [archaeon]